MQSSCSMFWSFVYLASRLFYFPVQQIRKNQTAAAGYLRSREAPGRSPEQRLRPGPGRGARSGAAASVAAAGGTRPAGKAVSPPATAGLFENRSATPQLGFLLFAGTDFLLLMLKRAAFAPLTRILQLCKAMYGIPRKKREGTARRAGRAAKSRCASRVPRQGTRRGLGRSARGTSGSRRERGSAVRSCQTKGRVGRPAPGRDAKRPVSPPGGAVRGPGRLPLRTEQSCSRAMIPRGPALREGPRRR